MNFKTKSIIAAGLAVLASSCTDLNVPIESQYTDYPSSEAAIEAKMANVYFAMRGCLGRRYMEAICLCSDEHTAITYSGNWLDSYAYINPSMHNQTPEDATIDWMGDLGRAIVIANEIIDSKAEPVHIASARAMRAFFTFIIMENWGDAPIIDQKYCDANGLDMRLRQARPTVARYIEQELLEIANDLPNEIGGDNYGKPSKWMAKALLAKLYINWPVYTANSVAEYNASSYNNEKLEACGKICDEIMKSNEPQFALGPDEYRFKFSYDNTERFYNGQIKDFIYVMPYETVSAPGMQWVRARAYKDIKNLKPNYFGDTFSQSGGGYITLIPEVSDRFCLKGDQRNLMVLGLTSDGYVYKYDRTTLLPTDEKILDKEGNHLRLTKDIKLVSNDGTLDVGDNLTGWSQGYRSVKWFALATDYNNGRNLSNDIPIFRYADIILTKAEVLVRQGNGVQAKELINDIRIYAKAEDLLTGNATLNDVYEERGREFFDEIWRRNDMIRFGHYEDQYGFKREGFSRASFDKNHRVFPVSKNDLDLNPLWNQNPGY